MSNRINYGKLLSEARRERKEALLSRCSIQAKASKAMRIVKLQGKNGHSMSAELLAAHGLNAKGGKA